LIERAATPKSRTFQISPWRNTFWGLRSRWTTPAAAAAVMPAPTWRTSSITSAPGIARRERRISESVLPSSRSITRYGTGCSPTSSTLTTLGASIAAAVRSSRKNRIT